MKIRTFFTAFLLAGGFANVAVFAQFDDLYHEAPKEVASNRVSAYQGENNDVAQYADNETRRSYDEDQYYYDEEDYYDDYDYEYSRRIRRFNSPTVVTFGYYSPFWYNNPWADPFYDPYFGYNDPFWYGGGNTVVINVGNGWGWNRWNRWNSWGWNNWGWNNGWNNWGWNSWNTGWNGWNRPWGWNSWGNGWNGCPPNYWGNGWNGGWSNNNGGWNNTPSGSYWGSRRSGSTVGSTKGRADGPRLTQNNPEVGATANPSTIKVEDRGRGSQTERNKRGDVNQTNGEERVKTERSRIYKRDSETSPVRDRNNETLNTSPKRNETERIRSNDDRPKRDVETRSNRRDNDSGSRSTEMRPSRSESSPSRGSNNGGSVSPSRSSSKGSSGSSSGGGSSRGSSRRGGG